jgi:hypothetical protein
MKKSSTLGVLAIAGVAVAIWLSETNTSQRPMATNTDEAVKQETPHVQLGMRVYVNPVTGEFISRPADAPEIEMPKELEEAMSTSHEGLVIEPGPAGSMTVDLRGRFLHMMTATADGEAHVEATCDTDTKQPADNDTAKEGE